MQCIAQTIHEAQKQVAEPLPEVLCFNLEAFGQSSNDLSFDEVLSFLYREGTFPRIVDIAVQGIKEGCTLLWIHPSGHEYVHDFSQTWNRPAGMGPFKPIGLMLPSLIWERPRPLSLQDLREAGEKRGRQS